MICVSKSTEICRPPIKYCPMLFRQECECEILDETNLKFPAFMYKALKISDSTTTEVPHYLLKWSMMCSTDTVL